MSGPGGKRAAVAAPQLIAGEIVILPAGSVMGAEMIGQAAEGFAMRTCSGPCGETKEAFLFTPGQLKETHAKCRACCSEKNSERYYPGRKQGWRWRGWAFSPRAAGPK
jgi:hypothetical protein